MLVPAGYSKKSRELAREHIEILKQEDHNNKVARKQKIKELSQQTNAIRKKLEHRKKAQDDEEEARRQIILKSRKLKQQLATEKFQRVHDLKHHPSKTHYKRQGSSSGLKDGKYKVRGHVIEIQNGVRVNSAREKKDTSQENVDGLKMSPIFQNSVYAPNSYLSSHLSNLLSDNMFHNSLDKKHDAQNDNSFHSSIIQDFNQNHISNQAIFNQDLRHTEQTPLVSVNNEVSSPTDSVCSDDSLNEERLLRSSLKSANVTAALDSSQRKVTFSNSIEFNDGKTEPLVSKMTDRIPLYKRIQRNETSNNFQEKKRESNSYSITTEGMLDLLRQEALLPRYPMNGDYNYPESLPSQNNVAVVTPLMSNQVNPQTQVVSQASVELSSSSSSAMTDDSLNSKDSLNSVKKNESGEDSIIKDSIVEPIENNNSDLPINKNKLQNDALFDGSKGFVPDNVNTVTTVNTVQSMQHNSNGYYDAVNNNFSVPYTLSNTHTITTESQNNIESQPYHNPLSYSDYDQGNHNPHADNEHANNLLPYPTEEMERRYFSHMPSAKTEDLYSSYNFSYGPVDSYNDISSRLKPAVSMQHQHTHSQQQHQQNYGVENPIALNNLLNPASDAASQDTLVRNDINTQKLNVEHKNTNSNSNTMCLSTIINIPSDSLDVDNQPCPKAEEMIYSPLSDPYSSSYISYQTSRDDHLMSNGQPQQSSIAQKQHQIIQPIQQQQQQQQQQRQNEQKQQIQDHVVETNQSMNIKSQYKDVEKEINRTQLFDQAHGIPDPSVEASKLYYHPSIHQSSRREGPSLNDSINKNKYRVKKNITQPKKTPSRQNSVDNKAISEAYRKTKPHINQSDVNKSNDKQSIDNTKLNTSTNKYKAKGDTSKEQNENHSTDFKSKDKIYEEVERNLAQLTFENSRNLVDDENNKCLQQMPTPSNHLESENLSDLEGVQRRKLQHHNIAADDKIKEAVREGTAIPIRVHSIPARRGRVIISADSKKRKPVGNFFPHPPSNPKNDLTSNNIPNENLYGIEYKVSRNTQDTDVNNIRNVSHQRTISATPVRNQKPPRPENHRTRSSTSDNRNRQRYTEHVNNLTAPVAHIALDKTPTDDEINKLWANVRECLRSETPDHAMSDSVYTVNAHSRQQRTFSGSSFSRRSTNKLHHDSLYRQNSFDSVSSTGSYAKRQALLPQRASRMIKSSVKNGPEREVFNGSSMDRHTNKSNVIDKYRNTVTSSIASFMALEELCAKQSLSPRQTEAVFEASKRLQRKQNGQHTGMTALSIEERCVMESLDRINKRLEEQENLKIGGRNKSLSHSNRSTRHRKDYDK
ncbi:probable serine/threonine-protein kinase DDB_G0282963 isoform X2 [Hydractinia symbiolongicarpus]|uniref:probable serine/threonine-protein kinase DDB_G0282963 isoform X2 n=1 Tax=Hydractinia symbiolongicarpus TaxID=13093 RepID=UPI00255105B3|nr:probable serine/threonine-protein kinase DDB_G0282963 isoform X2 [Hydractinia symbiolongicarpus]